MDRLISAAEAGLSSYRHFIPDWDSGSSLAPIVTARGHYYRWPIGVELTGERSRDL